MDVPFLQKRLSSPPLVFIIIAFSILLIYSNIYDNPFLFDDRPSIIENETIRDLSNFLSPRKLFTPRAVTDLSFALNYRFGELDVFGYHLVNVLVHILNSLLVYFLVLAVLKQRPEFSTPSNPPTASSEDFSLRSISLFAAMIFATHPIQTQAVTYTAQRYASLGAMFYLGSMLFYVSARTIRRKATDETKDKLNRVGLYALSVTSGLLAFLSKENTASLPGAILLLEYLVCNGTWSDWKKKLPWFALVFAGWVLFVLTVSGLFSGEFDNSSFLEDVASLTKETVTVGRWSYLCTQFTVLVIYIRLLLLPINQNLDYLYPFKTGFFDGSTPFAFLLLVAIAGFGLRHKKRQPVIFFGIFFFFITLSVESSIIPIRDALFEHRLYLPMFGFALMASCLLFRYLPVKRPAALILSFAIVAALGTATYLRNKTWKDAVSIWSDVVSKSPHNYRAFYNLGFSLYQQGQKTAAIENYLQAVRIKPDYAKAHNNLGAAFDEQGRPAEAIEHYQQALRIDPTQEKTHYNLGKTLVKQGRTAEAIEHYQQALRIKPDYEKAHYDMGVALYQQGRIPEAIEQYSQALRIKPDYAKAHNNLGVALVMRGRVAEAVGHYEQALRINPNYAEAHNNLGNALYRQGRVAEAVEQYLHTLRINPDHAKAHYNMGYVLQRQGRTEEAIGHYLQALRVNPDYAAAHNNLAVALLEKRDFDGAVSHFQDAIRINPDDVQARKNLVKALLMKRQSPAAR